VKIDFVQGGDRAIRGENSNAIAYSKLEQAATLKNGISYRYDVLYFYVKRTFIVQTGVYGIA
jgi:hypothetical protein